MTERDTTLLMTRPAEANEAFLAGLSPRSLQQLEVHISPLVEIVHLLSNVPLATGERAIFTSANGVLCAEAGQGRPAYCVGAQTASAARANGWAVEVFMRDADALMDHLIGKGIAGPFCHVAGCHRRGAITQRLNDAARAARVVEAYDQRLVALTPEAREVLAAPRPTLVPLFSPRTAAHFVAEAPKLTKTTLIALSPAVAGPLTAANLGNCVVSPAPTRLAMRLAVEKELVREWLG